MNFKIIILSILLILVILVVGLVLLWMRYGFWTRNPSKNDLPTIAECNRDFKIGVTTQEDLKKIFGNTLYTVEKFGDVLELKYRTSAKYDVGCAYQFNKDNKLQNILTFTTVG